MNMITGFSGGHPIKSFFAPFNCRQCQADSTELVHLPDGPKLAAIRLGATSECAQCGGEKFFDDFAESYLHFLRTLPVSN